MHLSTYRFRGDPAQLASGYETVIAGIPPESIPLNLAVQVADGLLVIDVCPSKADFDAISTSPEFAAALTAAGLPDPTIESVGTVVSSVGTLLGARV